MRFLIFLKLIQFLSSGLKSVPCAPLFAAFDKNEIRFILNELIQDSMWSEKSPISFIIVLF
jgi:hypothetical protein